METERLDTAEPQVQLRDIGQGISGPSRSRSERLRRIDVPSLPVGLGSTAPTPGIPSEPPDETL